MAACLPVRVARSLCCLTSLVFELSCSSHRIVCQVKTRVSWRSVRGLSCHQQLLTRSHGASSEQLSLWAPLTIDFTPNRRDLERRCGNRVQKDEQKWQSQALSRAVLQLINCLHPVAASIAQGSTCCQRAAEAIYDLNERQRQLYTTSAQIGGWMRVPSLYRTLSLSSLVICLVVSGFLISHQRNLCKRKVPPGSPGWASTGVRTSHRAARRWNPASPPSSVLSKQFALDLRGDLLPPTPDNDTDAIDTAYWDPRLRSHQANSVQAAKVIYSSATYVSAWNQEMLLFSKSIRCTFHTCNLQCQ